MMGFTPHKNRDSLVKGLFMYGNAMFSHLTVLTLEVFKPHIYTLMDKYCGSIRYNFAFDRPMLEDVLAHHHVGCHSMLLSFGTGVIVKGEELSQFGLCVNVHPAPPEYPGLHPHAFAFADHAKTYGVTAHVMEERVDQGPILMRESFAVNPLWSEDELLGEAVVKSFDVMEELLKSIFIHKIIPPELSLVWGEKRCTQKTYDQLRKKQGEQCLNA